MTGYKFVCTYKNCGKAFKRRDYLSRHEANHSVTKPFSCDICKFPFARRDLLDKHRNSKSHKRRAGDFSAPPASSTDKVTTASSKAVKREFIINEFLPSSKRPDDKQTFPHIDKLSSIIPPICDTAQSFSPLNSLPQPIPSLTSTVTRSLLPLMSTTKPIPSPRNTNIRVPNLLNPDPTTLNVNTPEMIHDFENFANLQDPFGWLFGSDLDSNHDINLRENETSTPMYKYDDNVLNHINYDSADSEHSLTEKSYQEIIDIIQNDMGISVSSSIILESGNIVKYLTQYWTHFDSSFPIIHKPSYRSSNPENNIQRFLTLAMITIGMAFMKPEYRKYTDEYLLAIEIHKKLKVRLIIEIEQYQNFKEAPLQLLQALLLTDFFNFYLGSTYQHQSCHIFHPLVINLLKELKMFTNIVEPHINENTRIEEKIWHDWVKYESLKRIAFFGYLLDAQSSFFYSKNQNISIFSIQLDLPYTDAVWYSRDPISFLENYQKQPTVLHNRTNISRDQKPFVISNHESSMNTVGVPIPNIKAEGKWPNFLFSIRRLMQPYKKNQKEYQLNCFPQFSRFIFLHGALSLIRELRHISILDVHIVPLSKLNAFASKIEQALFSWRSYFHNHIELTNLSTSAETRSTDLLEPLNDYGTTPMFWSNITVFNVGLLGLYCDFDTLLQYRDHVKHKCSSESGSSSSSVDVSIGGALSPERVEFNTVEVLRSEAIVQAWAKSNNGYHSNIEACNLLKMIFSNPETLSVVPCAPFAVYISVLVCWFYNFSCFDQISVKKFSKYGKSLDIVLQRQEIEDNANKYLSITLDEKTGYENGIPVKTLSKTNSDEKKFTMVKALALYSTTVLERCCQWTNANMLIDDLCSLLNVQS